MATYEIASPDLTANGTLNVISGQYFEISDRNRVLRGVAMVTKQNTPAVGDITWKAQVGAKIVGEGRSLVERSTGAEILAEDYKRIDMVVPAGQKLSIFATDTDNAVHNVVVSLILDDL